MAIEASALDAKPGAEVLEDFLKKEWVQNHFLEYKVWHWSAQNSLPSGKQPHKYGKSPVSIGKSTIDGPFSIANCNKLPEGKLFKAATFKLVFVTARRGLLRQ